VCKTKTYQIPLVPVDPSLVRSGCWLTAPDMASKRAGHANSLFKPESNISLVGARFSAWANLFRVTRMRPDSIMFEEPNASVVRQIT